MAERDERGRIKPGKGSLNPGGRPKAVMEVVALAREHTAEAIRTLARIMRRKDSSDFARIAAAEAILARAWGKPSSVVPDETTEASRPLVGVSTAQLLEIMRLGDGATTRAEPVGH